MKRNEKRAITLFLALLLFLQCAAAPLSARAAEQELPVRRGEMTLWRRGLPPKDGKWYHLLVAYVKGGSFFTGDGYKDGRYEGSDNSLLRNHKEIDLSKDSFYTAGAMNTPQARFNSAAQKGGYDPQFGSAPCYNIRMPDGKYLAYKKSSYDLDLVGSDSVSWAFVGRDFGDRTFRVAEGKYVIVSSAEHKTTTWENWVMGRYDVYLGVTAHEDLPSSFLGLYCPWVSSPEYNIYYGETVTLDTVTDNYVVGEDTVVNVNERSALSLAPGYTLTVADGGILSIGSGLFNNGTIRVERGGTLIVKENAFITPSVSGEDRGSIICEGGDVIVQKYGKVYCEGAAGLSLRGGTLYNYGLIVQLRGSDWRNDCVIHNEGAYYLAHSVAGASLQRFRDLRVETSSGRADFPFGETSNGRIINEECAWFTGNGCG